MSATGDPHAPPLPDAAVWRRWGIDPSWSRHLDVESADGVHRWHLLDTATPPSAGSVNLVCVHGNPTWAYAWATFLRRLGDRHRVVAVDQLGMGFSDRTGIRRYAERVDDLAAVIDALDLDDRPLVVAAHDWGGAIAMGWAVGHRDALAGMILCNTGIAVPEGRDAPGIIRLAASAPLRDLVCRRTSTFVEGTVRLSGRALGRTDRKAFRAPYRRAEDRAAIADFVGDIPLSTPHPSEEPLDEVAGRLPGIEAPVLLAWGARDPVFDDDFADDLERRLPNTVRHRFAHANHLVMAEADVAGVAGAWLEDLVDDRWSSSGEPVATTLDEPLWGALERRRTDPSIAVYDGAGGEAVGFDELFRRVEGIAAELVRRGLRPGDHVAMLTPPGIDLIAAVYGVWRAGGVTIVADRGLGLRGLGRAVRSARPDWVVGPRRARAAARTLRWAPRARPVAIEELVGARRGPSDELPDPSPDDPAAVLFTSGATGPAKGVRYTHGRLAAQRDALARTYAITGDDRLVAAFAPFALYGPALGIGTALPDCDVTAPGSLTFDALAAAVEAVDATLAFASPAALTNVVATGLGDRSSASGTVLDGLRLVMSAGAPVPVELLDRMAALAPNAELHTPYGMTEALPVADASLREILVAEEAHPAAGVCVGRPVEGAEVRVVPLAFDELAGVPDALAEGETGELLVRAPWVSCGYLGLWRTERGARPADGWHRSGDVGHLDDEGRLWVEGRAVHVVDHPDGPITSVPVERLVEQAGLGRPGRVAAVGVGPAGVQQLVVVIEQSGARFDLAPSDLAAAVRAVVPSPVAAVLVTGELPVDIRHNAKIDRVAVAAEASTLLAGGVSAAGGRSTRDGGS